MWYTFYRIKIMWHKVAATIVIILLTQTLYVRLRKVATYNYVMENESKCQHRNNYSYVAIRVLYTTTLFLFAIILLGS